MSILMKPLNNNSVFYSNAKNSPCDDICSGDLNLDNQINVLDIVLMVNLSLGTINNNFCADLNHDNDVNILDIVLLVNIALDPDYCLYVSEENVTIDDQDDLTFPFENLIVFGDSLTDIGSNDPASSFSMASNLESILLNNFTFNDFLYNFINVMNALAVDFFNSEEYQENAELIDLINLFGVEIYEEAQFDGTSPDGADVYPLTLLEYLDDYDYSYDAPLIVNQEQVFHFINSQVTMDGLPPLISALYSNCFFTCWLIESTIGDYLSEYETSLQSFPTFIQQLYAYGISSDVGGLIDGPNWLQLLANEMEKNTYTYPMYAYPDIVTSEVAGITKGFLNYTVMGATINDLSPVADSDGNATAEINISDYSGIDFFENFEDIEGINPDDLDVDLIDSMIQAFGEINFNYEINSFLDDYNQLKNTPDSLFTDLQDASYMFWIGNNDLFVMMDEILASDEPGTTVNGIINSTIPPLISDYIAAIEYLIDPITYGYNGEHPAINQITVLNIAPLQQAPHYYNQTINMDSAYSQALVDLAQGFNQQLAAGIDEFKNLNSTNITLYDIYTLAINSIDQLYPCHYSLDDLFYDAIHPSALTQELLAAGFSLGDCFQQIGIIDMLAEDDDAVI